VPYMLTADLDVDVIEIEGPVVWHRPGEQAGACAPR
jgi:hypothetical protein